MTACVAVVLSMAMAGFTARAESLAFCHEGAIAGQQGNLEAAIEHFSTCIEKGNLTTASLVTALYNRGTAHQQIGELVHAMRDYDKALALNPAHLPSLYNRATALEQAGDYQQAIADYGEVIRQDPGGPFAYVNRGNSYQKLGQHELAIQDYDEVIRRYPQLAPAYYNRASALQHLGRTPEAIRDFDEAIRLDPGYAQAYYARGLVHYRGKEMKLAFRDYNKAVSLDPGYKTRPYSEERLAVQSAAADPPQASGRVLAKTDKPAGAGGQAFALHFSSVQDEDLALAEWSRLQGAFPDLLEDKKLLVRPVDIEGKGRFFRVLTGRFPQRLQAQALCRKFEPHEQYCAVIPLDDGP